jgi:hypothetical protein
VASLAERYDPEGETLKGSGGQVRASGGDAGSADNGFWPLSSPAVLETCRGGRPRQTGFADRRYGIEEVGQEL